MQKQIWQLLLLLLLAIGLVACQQEEETPTPTTEATKTATESSVSPQETKVSETPPPPTEEPSLLNSASDMAPQPRLIGRTPAIGEEFAPDGIIELFFDQPMDETSTTAAIAIYDNEGEQIEGEITWPQPRIAQFKPRRSLKTGSAYQIIIDREAQSAEGVALLDGLTIPFSTIGELAISQFSPVDGADSVSNDTAVTIIFNRPVVPLLIAEEQADLSSPIEISPAIEGQGEWLNTSVYIFRPTEQWVGSETYTVRVVADTVNEMVTTGTLLPEDVSTQFTITAPTYRSFSLENVTSYPRNDYQHLRLDQPFSFDFAQPMDTSRTEQAITMVEVDGETAVSFDFQWRNGNSNVVFTPTQRLKLATSYKLTLDNNIAQSANGGLLRDGFTWTTTTALEPAIISVRPSEGTQAEFSSVFNIEFASRMSPESMAGKVIFNPPILGDPDGFYDAWSWSQRYYGLEPSTTYSVTLLAGMSDIYSNTIDFPRTFVFTTAPYNPTAQFQFPSSFALYRPGGTHAIWVKHRNLDVLNVDLYQVPPAQFSALTNWGNDNTVPSNIVWQQNIDVTGELNEQSYQRIDLFKENSEELLDLGLYFITLDSPALYHPNYEHWQTQAIVMANANVTLKTTKTETLIWVTDLETGNPLPNVPVALYNTDSIAPLFNGITDENGLAYTNELNLDTNSYQNDYYAITEDPTNSVFGIALRNWTEGINPYDFGIYPHYTNDRFEENMYVYTERPIYRPGQEVSFKGILRNNDDLQYSLSEAQSVQVEISSFNGQVFNERLSLSEFGTFAAQFQLDEEASLGNYYLSVRVGGHYVGGTNFNVAEYRKPTYQVFVSPDETQLLAGEGLTADIQASYFSGGNVVNGDVEWVARSQAYYFSLDGEFRRYSFNNRTYGYGYYYGSPSYGTFVSGGEGTTDGNGRSAIELDTDLVADQGSRLFSIEATVSDLSGNAVSGRNTIIVHQANVYPGVRLDRRVGLVDEAINTDVVVVDWDGNTVPDMPVRIEFVKQVWNSVQEEDEDGRTIWRSELEETVVQTVEDVVDGNGRLTLALNAPTAGSYKIYVTALTDNEPVASTYLWVSGSDFVAWRRINDHSFDLIPDADSYKPGDVAQLLIASPFQGEATALVTVERGHIYQQEVIPLTSNSTLYELPITGEMAPNMFVSVMVVKGVDPFNPSPDFKVSMIELNVDREEQELQIEIIAEETTLGPRDTATYTVRVSDYAGNPVNAELSLSVADLAALSLAPRSEQPILDYFYSPRRLAVRTSLILTQLMDDFNAELEEEIKGGGGGAGDMGIMTVRQNFPDTAYWEGQVTTGDDGEITFDVPLPDNLTTWRLDVRAITIDSLVGEATLDVVTTRPLIINPTTPRFFVVGDESMVGALVLNNTDEPLETTVTLTAEGVTVQDPPTQLVTIPANSQQYVSWQLLVPDNARADFTFTAQAGEFTDATKPLLGTLEGQGIPIYKYEVDTVVGTSGQLLEGGVVVESIGLPSFDNWEISEAQIDIDVAPSLVAAMTDGLEYLEHYEYECTEQVVSKFLPNVLTMQALQAAGLTDPTLEANLDSQVNIALQRLYRRQLSNGGWPWWEGQRANTLVSAYVVLGLIEAQEAGYTIPESKITRGLTYLENQLGEVDGLDGRYRFNRQAFIVYVLARGGQHASSQIETLFNTRERLDIYAQAYLLNAIYLLEPEDPRIETLVGDLITTAKVSATGTHWEESDNRDYWNWNSDTRTTAIVLHTLAQVDPNNPLIGNAVRWLMAHRVNGRWHGTQETAWTLMGLTRFMQATGELEANFEYEVAVNGNLLYGQTVTPDNIRETTELQVALEDLLTDELNRLAIGRTEGTGNLYYTTHLRASIPVAQITEQDRGFILSRSYYRADDRETAVTSAEQGETLIARLTIIVPESHHYVLIEDHLPAGLEAVDQSLLTSQQESAPSQYEEADDYYRRGWGWWYFDHVELRDEKVVISADYLPAGTYEYVYLVRASTPGAYQTIPPYAEEFYFPEVNGRGAGMLFTVRPRVD